MLDPESSQRLNLIRFPLIVGVVFIHAYRSTIELANVTLGIGDSGSFSEFVRNLVSEGIARIAVPLFFLMSGYLFFFDFSWSLGAYRKKLRARVRTLLIPFLFWNLLTLTIIAVAQAIPATRGYFSGKNGVIADFGAFDYLSSVLGIGRNPIAFQFWFIRDLMLLVLLVPVIAALLNYLAWLPLLVLLGGWLIPDAPRFIPSSEAALFFYVGAYLGTQKQSLFALDRCGPWPAIAYVPTVIADVLCRQTVAGFYLHKIGILLGIPTMLYLTGVALRRPRCAGALVALAAPSFFVFATHEPLQAVLRKLAYRLCTPETSAAILTLYFAIPILVIGLTLAAYWVLVRTAPRFLSIVTGGR